MDGEILGHGVGPDSASMKRGLQVVLTEAEVFCMGAHPAEERANSRVQFGDGFGMVQESDVG